ncbi:hypothetical protein Leryth_025737 [Lithospermum erythrorhizon]|nr:hypothetical protein Leryth_025737 [Lithospermum erythrorhizon]
MENYCGYGTSNSQAQSLYVGASSKASSSITMTNALQNGFHITIPNGSRHVSKKQVQWTHDHANERESKPPGALELNTTDRKQIKRIANRLSAQRSRKRKLEYKAELEAKAKCLQSS